MQTRPTAITGEETAARNRLTITVRVKYANAIEPDLDYDTSFSPVRRIRCITEPELMWKTT